jgi:hypothetical protein
MVLNRQDAKDAKKNNLSRRTLGVLGVFAPSRLCGKELI